jgi:hypothetical protein
MTLNNPRTYVGGFYLPLRLHPPRIEVEAAGICNYGVTAGICNYGLGERDE